MVRHALLAAAAMLVACGCGGVSDAEWQWCQAHIEAVGDAYDQGSLEAAGAGADWYFRQGDDSTRSNSYTNKACAAAYAAR